MRIPAATRPWIILAALCSPTGTPSSRLIFWKWPTVSGKRSSFLVLLRRVCLTTASGSGTIASLSFFGEE
jgi:hypothetical protein